MIFPDDLFMGTVIRKRELKAGDLFLTVSEARSVNEEDEVYGSVVAGLAWRVLALVTSLDGYMLPCEERETHMGYSINRGGSSIFLFKESELDEEVMRFDEVVK